MSEEIPVVYAITRRRDGRVYIGATVTGFMHRIGQHKSALNSSKHVKGKTIPQEMRDRISAALKGRKLSDEQREKRRAARQARLSLANNHICTA